MKLTKSFTAIILVAAVTLISCKAKTPKELIVNKWKLTEISGTGAATIPDSIKTKVISTAWIQFMKDGKFEASDMGAGQIKGTYFISEDGKTLSTTDDGKTTPDVLELVEIVKDKMVVNDKKNDVKMTWAPK